MTTCPQCGGDVKQSGRGRPRVFDTPECGKAWHNAARQQAILAAHKPRACAVCGGPIPFGRVGVKYSQKTCSAACESKRHVSRRGRCPICRRWVYQRKTSHRIYCSARCRLRAWARRHGWGYVPVEPLEPMPMPYVGDAIFEQARQAANLTSGSDYSVDWGQNDMLGEAVLAILEGRDPKAAVRKYRALEREHDRHRRWGVSDVGVDSGGTLIAVPDYDAVA